MFRNSKSKMQHIYVGVGSVVCGGSNAIDRSWLIAGNEKTSSVFLISNETFAVESDIVPVEDINFLSNAEYDKLIREIENKMNWTGSDFFIATQGMKGHLFVQDDAK